MTWHCGESAGICGMNLVLIWLCIEWALLLGTLALLQEMHLITWHLCTRYAPC